MKKLQLSIAACTEQLFGMALSGTLTRMDLTNAMERHVAAALEEAAKHLESKKPDSPTAVIVQAFADEVRSLKSQ